MRELVVSLPQSYKKHSLMINGINFVYDEVQNADVIVSSHDQIENFHTDKYIVLDVIDLNELNVGKDYTDNIDIFLVHNIVDYENLSIEFQIDKKRIFMIDDEKIIESYKQLFNKIYNLYKEKLYDIQVSLSPDKWVSTNKNLRTYTNNNKLVFEDNGAEKPYYISYEKLGSFSDPKIYNFNIEKDKAYKIQFDCDFDGNIAFQLFIIEFSDNDRIETHTMNMKHIKYFIPNVKTTRIRIAIRVIGKGKLIINKIIFRDVNKKLLYDDIHNEQNNEQYLVLTNAYPSYSDLYKNGFVHRRVIGYKKNNLNTDVFVFDNNIRDIEKYHYDGVQVYKGGKQGLRKILDKNNFKKILIHFINEEMYKTIKKYDPNINIVIWIHGYGAERWWRRKFNYTEEEIKIKREELEKKDEKQMKFMKSVYLDPCVTTIFVSNYIKQVAEEDAGCKIENSFIIPNLIDAELFKYRKKNDESRKKILMIRPFVNKKYGCDIAVNCILELTKKDYFSELSFSIYGDGPIFDEVLKPLREYDNVYISKGFLKQTEIAAVHRKHGIMLLPTRHDTQGVSMGEAMSSGLIVLTNDVWAIPEYIDNSCGVLGPSEDYLFLAQSIEKLYYNVDLFKKLSSNAAKRVRKQCSIDKTIMKEIEIIKS